MDISFEVECLPPNWSVNWPGRKRPMQFFLETQGSSEKMVGGLPIIGNAAMIWSSDHSFPPLHCYRWHGFGLLKCPRRSLQASALISRFSHFLLFVMWLYTSHRFLGNKKIDWDINIVLNSAQQAVNSSEEQSFHLGVSIDLCFGEPNFFWPPVIWD